MIIRGREHSYAVGRHVVPRGVQGFSGIDGQTSAGACGVDLCLRAGYRDLIDRVAADENVSGRIDGQSRRLSYGRIYIVDDVRPVWLELENLGAEVIQCEHISNVIDDHPVETFRGGAGNVWAGRREAERALNTGNRVVRDERAAVVALSDVEDARTVNGNAALGAVQTGDQRGHDARLGYAINRIVVLNVHRSVLIHSGALDGTQPIRIWVGDHARLHQR